MKMRVILTLFILLCFLIFAGTLCFAGKEEKPGAKEVVTEGVELKWLIGAGHNRAAYEVNKDHIKQTLGITITDVVQPDDRHYEIVMKDWQAGGGAYDIVSLHPRWNAELMAGYLLPLDDLIDRFDAWDVINDGFETYRKLYTERGGNIYGIIQDGDIASMYYRKDILGNPEYQKRFKEKYGYDLPVPPNTWDELLDVSEFFTGWDWDGDGEKEYGLSFEPWQKPYIEMAFLPIWGSISGGKPLFDENMRPLINSEDGVKTLKLMEKLLKRMPPGFLTITWSESFALFIEGHVPIAFNYGDIGRLVLNEGTFGGSGGPHMKGKIGYSIWPATIIKGKESRYASMCHGRIIGISQFSKNPEAAFLALKEIGKPGRNILHVSNLQSGSDPFAYSQMDINNWTINIDQEFLDAISESMKYGYPEPMIPGVAEYYDILRREVHAFLSGMGSVEEALSTIEKEWEGVTDRIGRQDQINAWKGTLELLRELGFKI